MGAAGSIPAPRIERIFQLSLVLLVANGFVALLLAGQVDPATGLLVTGALVLRLLRAFGAVRWDLNRRAATALVLLCLGFYPADLLWVSQEFVPSTLRLMFLLTALKLVIASTGREFFYLGLLGFLQLLSASMFISGVGYLAVLLAFLILSVVAYCSYEIRKGCEGSVRLFTDGRPRPWQGLGWRLAALGTAVSGAILMLSFALFLALPRMLSGPSVSPMRGNYSIGFSPEVNLGLTGSLTQDHTPVMRIETLNGADISALRWRGLALWHFDGVRWTNPGARSRLVEASGETALPAGWRRSPRGTRLNYRVVLEPFPLDTLFLAGMPEQISGSFSHLLLTDTDSFKAPASASGALRYDVKSWFSDRNSFRRERVVELFSERFRSRYLQLPPYDPRVEELARELVAGRRSGLRRAEAIEEHLRNSYGYTLQLPVTAAPDPIAHFLFERRRGHCEYFASTMALMLRIVGIPSRLVNGFYGGVPNPISGLHVVRASDAHSWVEAYIPGYGWLEFDPTPPNPEGAGDPWMMQAWVLWDAVQSAWNKWVLDYNVYQQAELVRSVSSRTRKVAGEALGAVEWLQSGVAEAWLSLKELLRNAAGPGGGELWKALAAIVLAPAVVFAAFAGGRRAYVAWLRRRLRAGRGRTSDSAYFYLRAVDLLERRGPPRRVSQTAEEFLAALEGSPWAPVAGEITAAYSAARFGGDGEAARRLPDLVRQLERTRLTH